MKVTQKVDPSGEVVASVLKAINILLLFKEKDSMGLFEIAEALDYPASSAHRLIATLELAGFIAQDTATRRYRLGLEPYIIGSHVSVIRTLENSAYPIIEALAAELNENAHISLLQGDKAVVVLNVNSHRHMGVTPQIGDSRNAYATAVGKCLLAFNSQNSLRRFQLYEGPLESYTKKTLVDKDAILAELSNVRKNGYALDDEEVEEGLTCVGAPIFFDDECIAAISCSMPKVRYKGREKTICSAVVRTARDISESL